LGGCVQQDRVGVVGLASIASLMALLTPVAASAGPADPHAEIFTGVEASNNAVNGYLGGGYAFGKGLYESGWRLRAVGSLGRYDYQGTLFGGGADLDTTFDGEASFAAALVGYQIRRGAVTLKLFAGAEAEDQDISPRDPSNKVQGSAIGFRVQAESWFDLSTAWFASVDAAYGTAFQEYWSLARLGWRAWPNLALGLEGGALGNEEYDAGRGGGFIRVKLRRVEMMLSGGFTGNYLEDDPSGYATLGFYRAF